MNNWEKTTLGEVCDTISSTYKKNNEKIVLINTSDVLNGKVLNHEFVQNINIKGQFKKTFIKDDILYSEIRPQNKRFAYVDFDSKNYIASTKLMVLRYKENVLPKFLYLILSSNNVINNLQAIAETRSGTFPQITYNELSKIEINLPPLDEQKRIADVLSALDDKIEVNNKINENLEAQAQAIFKQWFVDFEFPDSEGKPYKTNGGKFIDSELGEIPVGWKVGTLTQIASYLNGLAMQKFRPKEDEKGFPVLKIKELRQGCCDSSSDLCSERIDSNYIINNGDIIFSWSGTLMIDFWTGGICGLNQHLFKVESKKYEDWFVFLWTKHHLEDFIRIAKDKAVTMGHIKREHLDKAMILIPTNEIYNNVTNILKPIFSSIINLRIENKNLSEIRDSLLPKLMSGEVRV